MTPTMERAARALCKAHGWDPDQLAFHFDDKTGEQIWGPYWAIWVTPARTVLQSLLEPSDAAMEAGRLAPVPAVHIDSISGRERMVLKAQYRAIIRHILGETE